MIPIVIPCQAGLCTAMYRTGSGPAVLFCPPFGDEALKTARTWRDLAVALGERGIATLRFDLPGTGNSAGEPTGLNRVDAWRQAVRACAEWLSSRHQGRIILLGHRFGALLALDAVALGVDADRLILLDPPATGAGLARYLRARARLSAADQGASEADDLFVGGVPLSRTTLADLAKLPAPLQTVPPPALLILDPRPASTSPWPDRLRAQGGTVATIPFDGLDEFASSRALEVVSPISVLDRIVDHVVDAARPAQGSEGSTQPTESRLALDRCSETAIRFGVDRGMFGILCSPDIPAVGAPALLLPTMGTDPCSGMSRMWTELARRVGAQGITSLRFDMRGVGESEGDLGADRLVAMYRTDRVADLRQAIDALEAIGFPRVKIVGYCAGAYAAWQAAIPDPRIAAILAGNLVYLNFQRSLAHEVLSERPGSSRIGVSMTGLMRFLPGRALSALRKMDDRARRLVPGRVRRLLRGLGADPKQTRQHVKALVARGCSISLVMANDDYGHIRLRRAFGETPRLPPGVELTVIPDADHQFSDPRHRARFLDLAASFALRRHGPAVRTNEPPKPALFLETA